MSLGLSRYTKGGRKWHYGHDRIFRHKCMCKQNPYWQRSGMIIFLCKYYIVTWATLIALGCVFLVARCNIIGVLWEAKKGRLSCRKKHLEWEIVYHIFGSISSFLCHFCRFFIYSLPYFTHILLRKKFLCSRKWFWGQGKISQSEERFMSEMSSTIFKI